MVRRGIGGICCLLALALCLSLPALAVDNSGVFGVAQGGTLATFAQSLPAPTLTLDAAILADPANAVFTALHPDFAIDTDVSEGHEDTYGCACYMGETRMNAENFIEGDCFRYLYPDAARFGDGTYADVLLTYSDVTICTPTDKSNDYIAFGSAYDGPTACALGRTVRAANTNDMHIGVRQRINLRVVGKGGYSVDGSFCFAVKDIDVRRDGQPNYAMLYGSASNAGFSEHITILSGTVSDVCIPDASGYLCAVERDGDGLTFLPGGNDSDSFNSGFLVLADAHDGISLLSWTSGGGAYSDNGRTVRNRMDSILLADHPVYPLTVRKTVTGNRSDPDRDWRFTLSLENEDGTPVTGLSAPDGARSWDDTDKTSGNYGFTLRGGERLSVPGLAGNTLYRVTEETAEDYEQSYTVQAGSAIDGVTQYGQTTALRTLTASATLDFVSDWNEEPETPDEPEAPEAPEEPEAPQAPVRNPPAVARPAAARPAANPPSPVPPAVTEPDGGEPDGGEPDGGEPDGGEPDGGEPDGGETRGGETRGGEPDGGETRGGETRGGDVYAALPTGVRDTVAPAAALLALAALLVALLRGRRRGSHE